MAGLQATCPKFARKAAATKRTIAAVILPAIFVIWNHSYFSFISKR